MLYDIPNGNSNYYLYLIFGEKIDNNSCFVNLPLTNGLKDKLEGICIDYVNKITKSNSIEEFNFVGKNDNGIEKYDLHNNVLAIKSIEDFLVDHNEITNINDNELKDYNYFLIKVENNNEHYYFMRKPYKNNILKKGTLLSKTPTGQFEELEKNDMLTIDHKIDYIEDVNQKCLYIFNRSPFEKAQNLDEVYNYLTNDVLENQSLKDGIENYDELVLNIFENKHLMRRVSNLYNKSTVTLFLKQIKTTKQINEEYNLNLKFEDDLLVYQDKEQASIIVSFMQDAFYRTRLGNEKGTDTRR